MDSVWCKCLEKVLQFYVLQIVIVIDSIRSDWKTCLGIQAIVTAGV